VRFRDAHFGFHRRNDFPSAVCAKSFMFLQDFTRLPMMSRTPAHSSLTTPASMFLYRFIFMSPVLPSVVFQFFTPPLRRQPRCFARSVRHLARHCSDRRQHFSFTPPAFHAFRLCAAPPATRYGFAAAIIAVASIRRSKIASR